MCNDLKDGEKRPLNNTWMCTWLKIQQPHRAHLKPGSWLSGLKSIKGHKPCSQSQGLNSCKKQQPWPSHCLALAWPLGLAVQASLLCPVLPSSGLLFLHGCVAGVKEAESAVTCQGLQEWPPPGTSLLNQRTERSEDRKTHRTLSPMVQAWRFLHRGKG